MKLSWLSIGLVYRLAALIALLALVQSAIGMDRTAHLKLRRRLQVPQQPDRPDLPSPSAATSGIAAGQSWRKRLAGYRCFLAHRDASGEQEWMDLPGQDPIDLATMFTDLERVNRWLGGGWMTTRGLDRIFRNHDADAPITILDVASGSVDIPRAMSNWARRRNRDVSIIATDINPAILSLADGTKSVDGMDLVAADALNLPFADGAVDVVACSFFLHHLNPPDVVAALREMRRVSRGSVLVNDMVRGWPSFAGAWLFSRIFTRNPISRHDAPLSARRSYTRAELLEMAAAAGLEPIATYGFAGYRVVLVTTEMLATSRPAVAEFAVAPATTG